MNDPRSGYLRRLVQDQEGGGWGEEYSYDPESHELVVWLRGKRDRTEYRMIITEQDLVAYLHRDAQEIGPDGPGPMGMEGAFDLFCVDILEDLETRRDPFGGLRTFVGKRRSEDQW